jgi:hypothetical protein
LHRIGHGGVIAALQAVGHHDAQRAACCAGKTGHGEKRLQRIAKARAAVPVGHQRRRQSERLIRAAAAQRAA